MLGKTEKGTEICARPLFPIPLKTAIGLSRSGSVAKLLLFLMCSFMLVVGLAAAALHLRPDANRSSQSGDSIRIYCAAGVAKPVETVIAVYNSSYDANIEIVRTGGSGELMGQLKTEFETGVRQGADLYITADDVLLEKAHAEGIIAEQFPLAEQRPVIAVRADSSLQIASLASLIAQDEIRFGLASERASVGKLIRKIAEDEGLLNALESRKVTDAENVMTLAQSLAAGSLDAAVIWDTIVEQLNQENETPILKVAAYADANNRAKSSIAVGVLSSTNSPTAALKFCRYLCGSDQAKAAFEQYGFHYIPGDPWEETPEIHLFCGSMFTQ